MIESVKDGFLSLLALVIVVHVGWGANHVIGDASPCPPFACDAIDGLYGVGD
ncbi:MAG: hypothetical protein ACI8Y4_005457 [Candidatus Poriferisodalaceae bacterium]|jgi:hypothetical protein